MNFAWLSTGVLLRRASMILLAFGALTYARLDILFSRERAIATRLASRSAVTVAPILDERQRNWLEDFSWALQGVGRRVPFRADCLVRTLAADAVLGFRGWPREIKLQASSTEAGFVAHTWLTCGGVDVSGGAIGGFSDLLCSDA